MISYRQAIKEDWKNIAALHALSWQVNYRGSMTDDYLDNKVVDERKIYWKNIFEKPPENLEIIIAEEDAKLMGFSCLYLNADQKFGTYLDNLHVQPNQKRKGIGKILMAKSAQLILDNQLKTPLYLWVITNNVNAIKFYDQIGGSQEDVHAWAMPDGGLVDTYRYVWYDIEKLAKLG